MGSGRAREIVDEEDRIHCVVQARVDLRRPAQHAAQRPRPPARPRDARPFFKNMFFKTQNSARNMPGRAWGLTTVQTEACMAQKSPKARWIQTMYPPASGMAVESSAVISCECPRSAQSPLLWARGAVGMWAARGPDVCGRGATHRHREGPEPRDDEQRDDGRQRPARPHQRFHAVRPWAGAEQPSTPQPKQ